MSPRGLAPFALLALVACQGEDVPLVSASGTTTLNFDSTESEASSEDEGLLPKLDIFVDTSQDWLLHFTPDNPVNDRWEMLRIDLEDGATRSLCYVENTDGAPRATSATFTRDDRLMVSTGLELWEVTLPDCVGTPIATFPEGQSVINGITPDEADGLYGLSADSNNLVRVDPDTGEVTPLGVIDVPLTDTHGATWIDDENRVYLVEGGLDELFRVDPSTLAAESVVLIEHDFHWVGFEFHPHNQTMYGCSYDAQVVIIGADGATSLHATLDQPCNNLAAPWGMPELPSTD